MARITGADIRAAGARVVDWFTGSLLGLWVYGESLRTDRVWQEVRFQATALLLQFVVDFWAWSMAWKYALNNWALAITFGFVFASLILAYDRSVVVMDTGADKDPEAGVRLPGVGWRVGGGRLGVNILFRVCVLIFLAAITSIPTELAIFSPEINNRIDIAEKAAKDNIRTLALQTEKNNFDEAARTEAARAETALTSFDARRAARRTAIETARRNRQTELDTAAHTARGHATHEAGGDGPTGIRGAGSVFVALDETARTAETAASDHQAEANAELSAFDAQTQTLRARMETANATKLEGIENERQAKYGHIRRASPDKLANEYPGTWRQPRGFLARYKVLEEMRRDHAANMLVWGCRLLMTCVGLLVMGLKLTASQETKRYYSLAAQAAANQPQALEVVQNMGYTDPVKFGMEVAVRDRMSDLAQARRVLDNAIQTFWKDVLQLAQQKALVGSNRHQTYAAIRAALLKKRLDDLNPKINDVELEEERLRETGVVVPPWPANLNGGQNPLDPNFRPEDVTPEALARDFGWVDPQPELDRLEAARKRILELRNTLARLISTLDENDLQPERDLAKKLRTRIGQWRTNFDPCVTEMEVLERELTEGGVQIPEWPRHFTDPRSTLQRRVYGELQDMLRTAPPPPAHFCKQCGATVVDGTLFCGTCGLDQSAVFPPPPPPPPPPAPEPTSDCPKCGLSSLASFKCCPACGREKAVAYMVPCDGCGELKREDARFCGVGSCSHDHRPPPLVAPPIDTSTTNGASKKSPTAKKTPRTSKTPKPVVTT